MSICLLFMLICFNQLNISKHNYLTPLLTEINQIQAQPVNPWRLKCVRRIWFIWKIIYNKVISHLQLCRVVHYCSRKTIIYICASDPQTRFLQYTNYTMLYNCISKCTNKKILFLLENVIISKKHIIF